MLHSFELRYGGRVHDIDEVIKLVFWTSLAKILALSKSISFGPPPEFGQGQLIYCLHPVGIPIYMIEPY